jgi:hypothetical protein
MLFMQPVEVFDAANHHAVLAETRKSREGAQS